MPTVRMIPDTLNEENRKFEQAPLRQTLFLNSVPKCGSHLLRNIIRMFVPVEQQYHDQFLQWANLGQHLSALDPKRPQVSWGHLFFADNSAMELAGARKILLVRDPYSWVLARARFFLSDEFSGNVDRLKSGELKLEELLNLMIFGIFEKAPPIYDIFTNNAVAWLGTGVHLLRYEDLVRHLKALDGRDAEYFFATLLEACGIAMPSDWRERVRIGSDRKQSGTARENLRGIEVDFPDELPDMQKRLVDFAAPGLRAILGYV